MLTKRKKLREQVFSDKNNCDKKILYKKFYQKKLGNRLHKNYERFLRVNKKVFECEYYSILGRYTNARAFFLRPTRVSPEQFIYWWKLERIALLVAETLLNQ